MPGRLPQATEQGGPDAPRLPDTVMVDARAPAGTLPSMAQGPGAGALFTELSQLNSDPVLRTTSAALGVVVPDGQAVEVGSWPEVHGHYAELVDEVLTIYVLTEGRLVRHQLTRGGQTLTVAVAMSRVRRVLEERIANRVTVVIELDADRVTIELLPGAVDPSTPGDPGRTTGGALSGALTSSGYVMAGEDDNAARLASFAIALRAALR